MRGWSDIKYTLYNCDAWGGDSIKILPLTPFQKQVIELISAKGVYKYSPSKMSQVLKWSITGNCNLRCRHCYISSDKNLYGKISLEQCKEVIKQMLDFNIYQVAITGGEPLVRKDFWQLIDLFIENRIKI